MRVLFVLLATIAWAQPIFRVCADPNNLPFSNAREEGFDNRIARIVARDLDAKLEYVWAPARSKGYLRETLGGNQCDAVTGIPAGAPDVLATRPYYRSTYVFVSRTELHDLNDAALKRLRIGANAAGDDYPPPVGVLAQRGITSNIVGYPLFGPERDPAGQIVRAVESGEIDAAVVWGPIGGFFARTAKVMPIPQQGPVPFAFDIAIGVAPGNAALKEKLDRSIEREAGEIRKILESFRVPLL